MHVEGVFNNVGKINEYCLNSKFYNEYRSHVENTTLLQNYSLLDVALWLTLEPYVGVVENIRQ